MCDFVERVEHYTNGLRAVSPGVCGDCPKCADYFDDDGWPCDDGSFSYGQCGTCGSRLGGDRYVWHYIDDEDGTLQHEDDMCVNCVLYFANGDIPDDV